MPTRPYRPQTNGKVERFNRTPSHIAVINLMPRRPTRENTPNRRGT